MKRQRRAYSVVFVTCYLTMIYITVTVLAPSTSAASMMSAFGVLTGDFVRFIAALFGGLLSRVLALTVNFMKSVLDFVWGVIAKINAAATLEGVRVQNNAFKSQRTVVVIGQWSVATHGGDQTVCISWI